MKVAIIGHGYVGRGMQRLFERAHEVVVYDKHRFGDDDWSVVCGADLAVVCVPTPMGPGGAADVSAVREVAQRLDADLILIKSTVPPGTTDWLNEAHGHGRFHFSPEYMGEPRNFVPYWDQPHPSEPHMHGWVTVGGPRAGEVLDFFLPVMASSTRYAACTALEAELAKYMENAYFAAKVVFCSEFARIAEAHGADHRRVRELWLLDPRVEADHTVVFPGEPGYGGKCLPKDLAAIVAASVGRGYFPHMLANLMLANAILRGEETPTLTPPTGDGSSRRVDFDGPDEVLTPGSAGANGEAFTTGEVQPPGGRGEHTGWAG